jgi:hypothetical protein
MPGAKLCGAVCPVLRREPSAAKEMANLACYVREFAGVQDEQQEEHDSYAH